jgi:hypothetical protein
MRLPGAEVAKNDIKGILQLVKPTYTDTYWALAVNKVRMTTSTGMYFT